MSSPRVSTVGELNALSAASLGEPVADFLRVFARAVRTHQLYLTNNPMHAAAIAAVRASLCGLWEETDHVELIVTETELVYDGDPVYSDVAGSSESLAWLFYKEGLRSLQLQPGCEDADVIGLLDAIRAIRNRGANDEDLVTLLWECDFDHLRYTYLEAGSDNHEAPGAELLFGGAAEGTVEPPTAEEPSESPFAKIPDFDSTLYFLDDAEVAYLQREIRDEFNRDLRPSVLAALLDTFEAEDDREVREEICGILESFLLVLVGRLDFRSVAYLLRETEAALTRARACDTALQQRLFQLVHRMSDPEVVDQMLDALEYAALSTPQDDLVSLLAQLKPRALPPLLSHLVHSRNVDLRGLLGAAVTRLAGLSTGELIVLIDSDDQAVAMEAVRRAGQLKMPGAVAPLARLARSSDADARGEAVTALGRIGTPGALKVLEGALADSDRAVRITAANALGEHAPRAALGTVERSAKEVVARDTSSAEKSAYFNAYAALARDESVSFFESVLVPPRFALRKPNAMTRACAAVALGRVGSPRALDALGRATRDHDVIVRSAVARAIRGA